MTKLSLRLAALGVALGLAAFASAAPASAAAPKSKFEQAKIKAAVLYKQYYRAAFDSSVLGPEYPEVQERAERLRQEVNKALDEATDLSPNVRRAEAALRKAEQNPDDKDPGAEERRREDVQIIRINARGDIESEAHSHILDVADDDDDGPKKAAVACGEIDQKRVTELQKRIGIYEKRLADTQQELKNIKDALAGWQGNHLTSIEIINLENRQAVVERRVTRLKHDLEGYKKDLEAVLNPKPCPAPKTSEDKKGDKGDKGQRKESKTETGGPSGFNISIGIGGGNDGGTPRREEKREERRETKETKETKTTTTTTKQSTPAKTQTQKSQSSPSGGFGSPSYGGGGGMGGFGR